MAWIESLVRWAGYAIVLIGYSSLAVAIIAFGGYLISEATPCLCFDANGIMMLIGLLVILLGAVVLLWSRDAARVVSDYATKRLFSRKRQEDSQ